MKSLHWRLLISCFIGCVWSSVTMASEPAGSTKSESIVTEAVEEQEISESDREHWAFQPISTPALPAIQDTSWARNSVDTFVRRELENRDLVPIGEASRSVLLRRVHFTLIGLPPTPDEVTAFLNDGSPDAYERMVERLLASPAYGERWAQHWLDLARFAETDGFEHDKTRDGAWRYRQWVIDALNQDMPYDTFVRMQLAGDLISDDNAIATMFCLAGPDMPDANEQDLRRHDKLNEIASTVGAALLGLQMHCAQCHDHKYDPISLADFYRLRAVFETGVPELKRDRPLLQLADQTEPTTPYIFYRGELSHVGPPVVPAPPRIADYENSWHSNNAIAPRLRLADWLFTAENPLTARVLVNRIWMHHFGRSLCENPSDLGVIASGPTNPELLDHLATEFRKTWSLKELHRTLLTSATYRQASFPRDDVELATFQKLADTDPENLLHGRFNRKRLEGEAIRDSMLLAGDVLNHQFGGQSVMPPLPPEMLQTLLKGQWKASASAADHSRRSVYIFVRRNLRYPIFEAFDRPDAGATCSQRNESTTATQSLHLLNGDLTHSTAKAMKTQLLRHRSLANQSHRQAIIDELFLRTLARMPDSDEVEHFRECLEDAGSEGQQSQTLYNLIVSILNSNEFVYVD